MGCSVTRGPGCTGLLATINGSGELQTKRPTELSDGPVNWGASISQVDAESGTIRQDLQGCDEERMTHS
jgi:hypothetical protein